MDRLRNTCALAALLLTASGAAYADATTDGVATATKVVDALRQAPVFKPPGAPFDAKACMNGKRMLSIPNTSANPFEQGMIASEAAAGKDVGLSVTEWQNQGQPSQWVQGIDHANSSKYDVIDLIAGINPAVVATPIQQVRASGLKVFASIYYDISQKPDPVLDGDLAVDAHSEGMMLADWVIYRTKGHGRLIIVKSDEVLQTAPLVKGIHDEFGRLCPDCKIDQEINVGISEWGTKIQPSVQSALLAHPDDNFVIPTYDSMSQFIVPAVRLTGRADGVKIAAPDGTPFVIDMVRGGVVDMDLGFSLDWMARSTIDGYARLLCKLPAPTEIVLPAHIFDSANAQEAGVPAEFSKGYGDAYKAEFKTLWMLN